MDELKKQLQPLFDKYVCDSDEGAGMFRRKAVQAIVNHVNALLNGDAVWGDVYGMVEASVEFWFNRSSDIRGPAHDFKMDLLRFLQKFLAGKVDKLTEKVIEQDIEVAYIPD